MITKVIGTSKGFYDVARYLKKDRETGLDRDTGFRMGYNVSPDAMEAALEMAQAAHGRLMHEPCLHVVLSPTPAEGSRQRLSPAELEHMVGDLVREMGWQEYQILAVEHLDTNHQHVHLMINRAHPLEAGESIDGYYLYKDLRGWAQDVEKRQAQVEQVHEPDGQASASRVVEEGMGYSGEVLQKADVSLRDGQETYRLTNLNALSDSAGLEREVLTITEMERLVHEQEMALAMLRADARHLETTGQTLLSSEGRRQLRQTAEEIEILLRREQGITQEAALHRSQPESVHRGDGMPTPSPRLEAPPPDLQERIKASYQDLLGEARPYWLHPEAAVREMKDLAVLQGPEAVTWAIKHEPESLGQRTTVPMSEAGAERVAEAYSQYETHRREYVAALTERMDLQAGRTPARFEISESPNGRAAKELGQKVDLVELAEQLFYRDVTSRLLQERREQVQAGLGRARANAEHMREAVRERAYHHLQTALRETYKHPEQAFRRLEAYHRQGQTDFVLQKPELLGEMKRVAVRERVRGASPRKQAAQIVRRYGSYVEGAEVRAQLAAAQAPIEHFQGQLKVLTALEQRIGLPETIQRGYEEVRRSLSPGQRLRLGIRLQHVPGSTVHSQSENLLKGALRDYPGRVRPGHIRGLASQKAMGQAMRQAARDMGKKMALKKPLSLAMRSGGFVTRAVTTVYRTASVFFER